MSDPVLEREIVGGPSEWELRINAFDRRSGAKRDISFTFAQGDPRWFDKNSRYRGSFLLKSLSIPDKGEGVGGNIDPMFTWSIVVTNRQGETWKGVYNTYCRSGHLTKISE